MTTQTTTLVTVAPPTLYATTETVIAYLEHLAAEQKRELAAVEAQHAAAVPPSREWIWSRQLVLQAREALGLTEAAIRAEPVWHEVAQDPDSALLAGQLATGRIDLVF